MSELSPQAQAVLDALSMGELNGPQQLMARAHAAAALRAAAVKIEDLYCDSDVEDSGTEEAGIVFALRQLMLIADELEAQ
jgi:hypothetical protein